MDATTEATVSSFFAQAPRGEVDVTMAGDSATHRMPANLAEVGSFVSFNDPGNSVKMGALELGHLLGSGPDIDLSSISGPENNSGPILRGTNYAAIKPKTPGLS